MRVWFFAIACCLTALAQAPRPRAADLAIRAGNLAVEAYAGSIRILLVAYHRCHLPLHRDRLLRKLGVESRLRPLTVAAVRDRWILILAHRDQRGTGRKWRSQSPPASLGGSSATRTLVDPVIEQL